MTKRHRNYTDREREFYDAKRAMQAGKIVVVEFDDESRHLVDGLRMNERKPYVLTLAGRSFNYKCLMVFSTITDALNALYEKSGAI